MLWFTSDGDGMVKVVVVRGVEAPCMRVRPSQLVAAMVADTIPIEEYREDRVEKVKVGRHDEREKYQRQGTAELVSEFVSNHSEGCGVEEHVVVAVPIPHALEPVAD